MPKTNNLSDDYKKGGVMTKPYLDNVTQAFIDNIESRGGKPLYEI